MHGCRRGGLVAAQHLQLAVLAPASRPMCSTTLRPHAPAPPQEEADEFFDASSLLGSLGQAFSSAMASSRAPADGGGAASLQGGADLDMLAMHDLAASIREVSKCRGWQAQA